MQAIRATFLTLSLAALLPAQTPPAQAPAAGPAAPAPVAAPAKARLLKAQYEWGYAGADGQGKGTLNVLLEPASGRAVVELQGLGERLMLLEGDAAGGYRVRIPRQQVDQTAPSFAGLPLPFLPQVGSPEALYRVLSEGDGPGVKVTRRDAQGPASLRYQGTDAKGKEVLVWLKRTRWELADPA